MRKHRFVNVPSGYVPSCRPIASTAPTGHLLALPRLVKSGQTAKLYWNVSNILSCSVSGNNDSWSTLSSGSNGATSSPIQQQSSYTLRCLKLPDGASSFSETQTINIIPL